MVYVVSKNNLLSLKIVTIDLFFNLTLFMKIFIFQITSKLLSSTQECNSLLFLFNQQLINVNFSLKLILAQFCHKPSFKFEACFFFLVGIKTLSSSNTSMTV